MKEQFTQRLKKIEDVLSKKLSENFSSNWQWGIFNTSLNQEFSQNEIEKLVLPFSVRLSRYTTSEEVTLYLSNIGPRLGILFS